MTPWDNELFEIHRYEAAIERLSVRADQAPSLRQSAPIDERMTLDWVLRNRNEVVDTILGSLSSPEFQLGPHLQTPLIIGGKTRKVYIPSWPDRILLAVTASIIAEKLEPLLSPRVFSFRKGTGPWHALREFSAFLKTWPRDRPVFVLRRDIQSYGESISHSRVMNALDPIPGFSKSRLFRPLVVQALAPHILHHDAPPPPLDEKAGVLSG
ncbi:hypothetical protein WDW86_00440, partial [Bdellovibrionota bacterium FG-2]